MMLPGPMGNKAERYALPARVSQGEVDQVIIWLVHSGGTPTVTLDFTDTSHIDFRAVRALVARVRQIHSSMPPIRVVGLSPYCEQILRFSLEATDWDLFDMADGDGDGGRDRKDAAAGSPGAWGGTSGSSLGGAWAPCPN